MKYRVVPCIGEYVYYKVQIKKLFRWVVYKEYQDYCMAVLVNEPEFKTIKEAISFMEENFGNNAYRVDFEVK